MNIVTQDSGSYGLDDQNLIPGGVMVGFFLFTTASITALGPTQPPIQWVPGSSYPRR